MHNGKVIGYTADGLLQVHVGDAGMIEVEAELARLKNSNAPAVRAFSLLTKPFWRPLPDEEARLTDALRRTLPGGRTTLDVAQEIRQLGHEVYVVGGAVRDAIRGSEIHDVDLIGTLPTGRARNYFARMFRSISQLSLSAKRNGHLRIGGAPGQREFFIDYCVFKHSVVGTRRAVFDSDFDRDFRHRDFACNALYYDMFNNVIIDPSNIGISDSEGGQLTPVWDDTHVNSEFRARVTIRLLKFLMRGYQMTDSCSERVVTRVAEFLECLEPTQLAKYIRAQVISKNRKDDPGALMAQLMATFRSLGCAAEWDRFIEPIYPIIIKASSNDD